MRSQAASTVFRLARSESGQATVELAIVIATFLAIAVAFGGLWDSLRDGVFVDHAIQEASHHIEQVSQGAWGDVLAY